jgi:hypothetical protein
VNAGTFNSGFEHFAKAGFAEKRAGVGWNVSAGAPVAGKAESFFDASYYLKRNPAVLAAVAAGKVASAWAHFVSFGQYEKRRPSALFDEGIYLTRFADVRAAVRAGVFESGFEHFVRFGFKEGRRGV